MRLIDADELIKDKVSNAYISIFEVKLAPTVEAKPIRHAHWKDGCCTNCGIPKFVMNIVRGFDEVIYEYEGKANYCPNCGAEMDGNGGAK